MYSVMNDTKRKELRNAMIHDMPFPPPYVVKTVKEIESEKHIFDEDVTYQGDRSEETLRLEIWDFKNIERIKIRPRYWEYQGRLIADKLIDETDIFTEILHKYNIPYEETNGTYIIYGYK